MTWPHGRLPRLFSCRLMHMGHSLGMLAPNSGRSHLWNNTITAIAAFPILKRWHTRLVACCALSFCARQVGGLRQRVALPSMPPCEREREWVSGHLKTLPPGGSDSHRLARKPPKVTQKHSGKVVPPSELSLLVPPSPALSAHSALQRNAPLKNRRLRRRRRARLSKFHSHGEARANCL